MDPLCNCWNKLKEEIKANAIYEKIQPITPVNSVIKVKRYAEQSRQDSGSSSQFMELLNKEQEKTRQRAQEKKEEKLRCMAGMNQYNRHAAEVFFLLSRNMDYKA